MIVESILIGGIILALLLYLHIFIRPKSFPPGPIPLPIIGNMHLLTAQPQKDFQKLSRKYGDVFSLFFGGWRVVIVNSIEAAKESLIQKTSDFAGRPPSITGMEAARGQKTGHGIDIVFADYGPYWQTVRKLAHKALKMYGANREQLEKNISVHCGELIERLSSKNGEAFYPRKDLCLVTTNIICTIVLGSKYDINDEEFTTILYMNDIQFQGIVGSNGIDFLTWLRYFPNKNINLIREAVRIRDPILEKWLAKHKETFLKGNIRDFTDALIDAADEEITENKKSGRYLEDDNLIMIMSDIFSAAIETTSTTMSWFIVFSVLWPEKQKKIHQELDRVIGHDRIPCMDDRSSMPYLEAAINETARLGSTAPLILPHRTTCDTSLSGYKIPKHTHVIFNLYAIHYDERHWKDPGDFQPERWLDEDGTFTPGKNESFLPFSAGKRVCFGEALAKMELFLILSRVFQRFEFFPADGEELPSTEGVVYLTHEPKEYKVVAKKRF